jgi:D-sedoheptulose 7-phosphate isomerase
MDAVAADRVEALLARRTEASARWFGGEAERLAELCHEMAERFARGGRLLALGATPAARSDARHVAVEFVHPVIVGKRALPAIGLAAEGGPLLEQVVALSEPDDIVMPFGPGTDAAVDEARRRGCLTVALEPPVDDPYVRQELVETAYHVLWELVHVFLEHSERNVHDTGAASFLYPFLGEGETDVAAVREDVRRSVLMKADEVSALRAQTLTEGREALLAAAAALREAFVHGGRLLALGNGGSATDAMDLAADLRAAGRAAVDLTEDAAILTAIANDIGVEAIFARQVIAYGRAGDVLVALSTSGGSANVLAALAEARRRRLVTVALVGYDGGRIAAEGLADHVVVSRSQHIPRIQEAQASAYHVLCELVG